MSNKSLSAILFDETTEMSEGHTPAVLGYDYELDTSAITIACTCCGDEVGIEDIVGPEGECSACYIEDSVEAPTVEESVEITAPEPEPAKVTLEPVTPVPTLKKGSLVENTSAPKAKEPKKAKAEKTVLDSGLTYSLLSRVRNAFSAEVQAELEAGSEVLEMVDGRGATQLISSFWIGEAEELGGADYLKTVRTSHLRKAYRAAGVKIK